MFLTGGVIIQPIGIPSSWRNGKSERIHCVKRMALGADHSTSEGGGGGWVILKKNILQVHMHKKKILAQDHRAKKNSCTYSGLEKKFWQDVL